MSSSPELFFSVNTSVKDPAETPRHIVACTDLLVNGFGKKPQCPVGYNGTKTGTMPAPPTREDKETDRRYRQRPQIAQINPIRVVSAASP